MATARSRSQARGNLFRGAAAADTVESRGFHPVMRLNITNTPADGPEELKANLLEVLDSQYTLWNRRRPRCWPWPPTRQRNRLVVLTVSVVLNQTALPVT